MQKIAMRSNQVLQWRQPNMFEMEYELRPGENLPELPWMVLLGWYLAVMMSNDATTAAAMTVVAVS